MKKPSSASKIKMTSYDELFGINENKQTLEDDKERIQQIPLIELFPFPNHPFQVKNDDKMIETKESIEKYGVLVPIIVRPRAEGGYEIIAGHRRKHACELLKIKVISAIVRELEDEESTIIMVDSNIQRENLRYSEKAFAYKMKLDAIKMQGKRTDLTCAQVGQNYEKRKTSVEIVAEQSEESRNQVKRYIRLTELISDLLNLVDDKKLAFNTAVELSYLSKIEQQLLLDKIEELEISPSMTQATHLKAYSKEETVTEAIIVKILLQGVMKPTKVILKTKELKKYFPTDYSPEQMEAVITQLLEKWHSENKDII